MSYRSSFFCSSYIRLIYFALGRHLTITLIHKCCVGLFLSRYMWIPRLYLQCCSCTSWVIRFKKRYIHVLHLCSISDYIQRAMAHYQTWYNKITFIVLSDDIRWCRENIHNSEHSVIFSPFSNPGNDLSLMSLCDHMIMTTGTFGWWGSWLAGGHVIYYGGYPRLGSELDKHFVKEDFYPKQWTQLEWGLFLCVTRCGL